MNAYEYENEVPVHPFIDEDAVPALDLRATLARVSTLAGSAIGVLVLVAHVVRAAGA